MRETQPDATTPQIAPPPTPTALPIGGWLLLISLGVVFTPFMILYDLQMFPPLFADGTWEYLTSETSQMYHPLWGPLILGELIVNLALLGVSLYLAYLFFARKLGFPGLFVAIRVFVPLFILLDGAMYKLILPAEPMFDPISARQLATSIIAALIWIPYMKLSKRVKATFVN
jgi:hypothetical protein